MQRSAMVPGGDLRLCPGRRRQRRIRDHGDVDMQAVVQRCDAVQHALDQRHGGQRAGGDPAPGFGRGEESDVVDHSPAYPTLTGVRSWNQDCAST